MGLPSFGVNNKIFWDFLAFDSIKTFWGKKFEKNYYFLSAPPSGEN
jgi:hypothetical protein